MKFADKRNLNPSPAAVVAMSFYGKEYAAQNGGCMDFWDKLDQARQRFCSDVAMRVIQAHHDHN